MGRVATLILCVTAACGGDRNASQSRESSRVEAAIEKELSVRVGVGLRVACVWIPPNCRATLPDGSKLGLRIGGKDGALTWRLDGGLVLADDIEAYLRDVLADLGKPQVARCGQRIRAVRPDDRIECQLQHGGKAFVLVNRDGSTSTEILLDPVAGDARAEVLTIEREQSLLEMSRKLGETDDDDSE